MGNFDINRDKIESLYAIAMAKDIIFKFRSLKCFEHITIDNIFFMRNEMMNLKDLNKDCDIRFSGSAFATLTPIKFIVFLSNHFDNMSKHEQERNIFHVLMHVPKDYKTQFENTGLIKLRSHDFEIFQEESSFLESVTKEKEKANLEDKKNFSTKAPLTM